MMLSIPFVVFASLVPQNSKYDELGTRICPLNDVDGDHCADFALDDGLGWAWIVSGKTGKVLATVDTTDEKRVGTITPLYGDVDGDGSWDLADSHGSGFYLRSGKDLHVIRGLAVPKERGSLEGPMAPAGDWNGDGIPDVAVLASKDDLPWIAILSCKDGSLIRSIELGKQYKPKRALAISKMRLVSSCNTSSIARASFALAGVESDAVDLFPGRADAEPVRVRSYDDGIDFQRKCGFIGDVDGDGLPELVVATPAPAKSTASPRDDLEHYVGEIVSGRTGKELKYLPESNAFMVDGIDATVLAKNDASKPADIVVGFSGWTGECLVLDSIGKSIRRRIDASDGCCHPTQGRFAATVCALGDIDGDGVADFAIGASGGPDGMFPGCVSVFSGKSFARIRALWRSDLVKK